MRCGLHRISFVLLYILPFMLISCSLETPTEMPRDNPYDGRNPDAVPEVMSIVFKYKSDETEPAVIEIETRAVVQIKFCRVNQSGDPITTGYQSVESEYQLELSEGDHIIAAQGKALNGSESAVKYQSITVEIGITPGEEQEFPLGESGESIVMCWIPVGWFDMGSPVSEQDRDGDEGPVHRVTFEEGFWLCKYEVTQAQWEAVMGENPSYFDGHDHPVEQVSWNDIQDFESHLDNSFRLPSESEWEYACRGGTTTRFYWGDDASYSQIGNYAWYYNNSSLITHDVGTKQPNGWGLHDMSGNVWEWCEDWYHSDYAGAPGDGSAWVSPSGAFRVIRCGGWLDYAWNCRSASRLSDAPDRGSNYLGFRLARLHD